MFDCVVIGGGIIGVNVMHCLQSIVPEWNIALIERALVGAGASFYSAGLSFPYGRTPSTRNLAAVSEKVYNILKTQIALPITPAPFLGLVSAKNWSKEYKNFISPPLKKQLSKKNFPQSIGRVIFEPNDIFFQIDGCHSANVSVLTSHLIENIRHHSTVKIWEGTDIVSITDSENTILLGLRDGRTLSTRHVILTVGPWIKCKPFSTLATSFGIQNKKVISLHIDKTPRADDPILFFLDHDAFLLPLHARGHWLFSYTCQEWDVLPDAGSLMITSNDRIEALKILEQYCPDLIKDCCSGRVFCDAYSPDRIPITSVVPTMPRVILAGAANGSGYRLAPAIAQQAVQLVLQNNMVIKQ